MGSTMMLLVLLIAFIDTTSCSEQLKKEVDEIKCKGVDVDISSEQMSYILECAQELGVTSKSDVTAEKRVCFAKCMTEKQGLVDASGKLHKEKIEGMVDASINADLAKEIKTHLNQCMDQFGSSIDPKDATCQSYEPLTTCTHKAFLHLCTGRR